MAPSQSRQLLVWTLPTIAVLLSYLWFKKKRINSKSDPGDNPRKEVKVNEKSLAEELAEAAADISDLQTPTGSPIADRSFSRTLSGTESTPIDIIIPRELRSHKTSPVIISDEDLDFEIEKIKSMKTSIELFKTDTVDSPQKSPTKQSSPIQIKPSPIKTTWATTFEIGNKSKVKSPPKKMETKAVTAVEQKLGSLKLETSSRKIKGSSEDERHSSERDSANHSPADVMLASPSLSCISDNHSEGSSDSGKGGSDVATPPSRTPAGDGSVSGDVNLPTFYEFVIPQPLVGRLIGRYGCFVAEIKEKSRAHVSIKKHPKSNKSKICIVEGPQNDIDNALQMIRERFPLKRYPEVTMTQVSFLSQMQNVPLTPDHLYLKLVEGINNDTIISCMVTPGHLFLQQPTHPSFPSLHVLTTCMNMSYSGTESPLLPSPVKENTICVAQTVGEWYRAIILSTDRENDTSYVTFLDYGGYAVVENSKLRQIRGDFLLLPFQAAECILANIRPVGGEDAVWMDEAYSLLADITKGAIALTQIAEYTEDGIPLVLMYIMIGPQEVIFLNEELVTRGFAEYITKSQPIVQGINEIEAEGAVGGLLVA